MALVLGCIASASAIEPGDVIASEVYLPVGKLEGKERVQCIEFLVVKDKVDLNGMQLSTRPKWNIPTNDQCTLQDMGSGFLSSVPAGTLLVILNGKGKDDTNSSDFTLSFYAQSSVFCNVAPTGHAFRFGRPGMAFHLLHLNKQVDFVKYRASDATHSAPADPGTLGWENGVKGHIDFGKFGANVGFRFMGNKPDLNDFPAAWIPYPDAPENSHNLGEPNGGLNTEWIMALRAKASKAKGNP